MLYEIFRRIYSTHYRRRFMEIAVSSVAGLACAFYLVVLGKFTHAHYKEVMRRRVRPAITHLG